MVGNPFYKGENFLGAQLKPVAFFKNEFFGQVHE
jgi:hypothetical protein